MYDLFISVLFLVDKNLINQQILSFTFGAILTISEGIRPIYTGIEIIDNSNKHASWVVIRIIAMIVFFTEISLIKTIKGRAYISIG